MIQVGGRHLRVSILYGVPPHAHQLKHFITPQNEKTVFFLLVNEEK